MKSKAYHDDGGLTWQQCVSLAETVQAALDELFKCYRGPDGDDADTVLSHYLQAEQHISRLVKRAKVMRDREVTT